ncbi:hypothetical protein INT43_009004 [Umbelopsis isabellina]|uniref:Uncharacterized protein n=1 Tax=Mortierella isabellina TaxID=91625 RepID=A0A8H7PWK8_MORIS|nr:hypothetical protein INT43_009004 [Umbelopsis isabellina]
MATHAPAWMPFANRQHSSYTLGGLTIPFISTPPSALHYSFLGFRGSSAPPVLSHPPDKSPTNTFAGYFRSNKVRPSSSYAESGPYNQRSRQVHAQNELVNVLPIAAVDNRYQTVSRDFTKWQDLTDVSAGQVFVYSTIQSLPQGSLEDYPVFKQDTKGKDFDEKSFVSWQESRLTDSYTQDGHLLYGPSDFEPARPRSFPYFLPMPLKRVLNRHTWTDCEDRESSDDAFRPSISSNNTFRVSQNLQAHYNDQMFKTPERQWTGFLNKPSPAPSSEIMDNMHRNVPTVSSLSLSEISLDKPRPMHHIMSSPYQMADINAVERGFSYRPSPPQDRFWNDQTLLFLFGFLFFPLWWIGAFKAIPSQKPKVYNAYLGNTTVLFEQDILQRPPPRSPSPIVHLRSPKPDLATSTKRRFQQMNRIMTVISMILLLFAAGMLIWYGIGF